MPDEEIEILVLEKAYDSKVSSTHILRAAEQLRKVLIAEQEFHPLKGEYPVELNGNRIALIYEIKRNEEGIKVLGIKHARYLKGKPKRRKMVER
jgi:hypothetical protein